MYLHDSAGNDYYFLQTWCLERAWSQAEARLELEGKNVAGCSRSFGL